MVGVMSLPVPSMLALQRGLHHIHLQHVAGLVPEQGSAGQRSAGSYSNITGSPHMVVEPRVGLRLDIHRTLISP